MRNMLSPRQWVAAAILTTVFGGGGIAVGTGFLGDIWQKITAVASSIGSDIQGLIAYLMENWHTTLLPVGGVILGGGLFVLWIMEN